MHQEKCFARTIAIALGLVVTMGLATSSALAIPDFYDSHCETCHGGARSCDGCHFHRGALSASADKDGYAPGDPVVVTLNGGTQGGWIRAILYDENNTMVGLTNHVPFPVDIAATAPMEPGAYHWEAAWFGSTGTSHLEERTPVMIAVSDPPASVEDEGEPGYLTETWGKIKNFFR